MESKQEVLGLENFLSELLSDSLGLKVRALNSVLLPTVSSQYEVVIRDRVGEEAIIEISVDDAELLNITNLPLKIAAVFSTLDGFHIVETSESGKFFCTERFQLYSDRKIIGAVVLKRSAGITLDDLFNSAFKFHPFERSLGISADIKLFGKEYKEKSDSVCCCLNSKEIHLVLPGGDVWRLRAKRFTSRVITLSMEGIMEENGIGGEDFPIEVNLGQINLSLDEVLSLRSGNTLEIDIEEPLMVTLSVGGAKFIKGSAKIKDDKMILSLEDYLVNAENFPLEDPDQASIDV